MFFILFQYFNLQTNWIILIYLAFSSATSILVPHSRTLFSHVRIAIEITEHEQHEYILYCHYECNQFRITAVGIEDDLHEMQTEQQKLYHLHLRDVFLPPNRSFDILVDGADQIVSVHNGMHQTIEHTDHRAMSGRQKSNTNPYTKDHCTMMIHMQEGDVCETFAYHKKYLKQRESETHSTKLISSIKIKRELTVSSRSNILSKKNKYVANT